uniref:NADH dehydrogenase [ubiquinone] 1 alpha subcomplex subunit 6 n=1 Tax=Schistocephalus solidus TaxID=70667 RepID=A0A0X3NSV1_SCHSO
MNLYLQKNYKQQYPQKRKEGPFTSLWKWANDKLRRLSTCSFDGLLKAKLKLLSTKKFTKEIVGSFDGRLMKSIHHMCVRTPYMSRLNEVILALNIRHEIKVLRDEQVDQSP